MRAVCGRAPETDSERCGRALCEEGRRLGGARLEFGDAFDALIGDGKLEGKRRDRRAGGQGRERIAQTRTVGVGLAGLAAGGMNQPALPIHMLQRVQQGGLPSGKQGYDQEDAGETGAHGSVPKQYNSYPRSS
jgi:hypothetical protein